MKTLYFLIFACIFTIECDAQTEGKWHAGAIEVTIVKQRHPKKIYATVQILHAFPGGDSGWIKSVEDNINQSLPFRNGAKKGTYLASVKFIITKDGSISDLVCYKNPGYGMGEAVRRAVMRTRLDSWLPAQQRKVNPFRSQYITNTN